MFVKINYLKLVSEKEKQAVENFLNLWSNNDSSIKIHTSGSTGKPKEIEISKAAMIESAKATGAFFNFKSSQRSLLALNASYVAGMMQIVRAIVFDMELVVVPVGSNPLQYSSLGKLDFAAFVPLQVAAILEDNQTKMVYEKIRNVIIGGAPINESLNQSIGVLSNHSFATFGMTETISHIALRAIENDNKIYKALPGVHFFIKGDGCLQIKVPRISKNDISTTDRVNLISDNAFEWLGRSDFVINSGGVKIQPELVENKLSSLIKNSYYISSVPDNKLGSSVVLYIESEDFKKGELNRLIKNMQLILGPYEVPKRVLFEPNFSRTLSGKIIRK